MLIIKLCHGKGAVADDRLEKIVEVMRAPSLAHPLKPVEIGGWRQAEPAAQDQVQCLVY